GLALSAQIIGERLAGQFAAILVESDLDRRAPHLGEQALGLLGLPCCRIRRPALRHFENVDRPPAEGAPGHRQPFAIPLEKLALRPCLELADRSDDETHSQSIHTTGQRQSTTAQPNPPKGASVLSPLSGTLDRPH